MSLPVQCRYCASAELLEIRCTSGPHYARLKCASCDRQVAWIPKPQPSSATGARSMWRNPKYRGEAATDTQPPPVETGRRLATFERSRGSQEVRVNLDEYEGRPYVAVRLWERGEDGRFYPTRKGCSVRLAEIDRFIEALEQAKQLAEAEAR